MHRSQNSTSPRQYLQGLILLLVLFVEVLDAVEAVLEMVLAIVCRVGRRGAALLGFGTRGLGGATGDDAKGRRDVPLGRGSPVGVSALSRRAALWQACRGAG